MRSEISSPGPLQSTDYAGTWLMKAGRPGTNGASGSVVRY